VTGISAVGIHNDFTSGESAVAIGSADHEASGGIDVEFGFIVNQLCGQNGIENIFFDVFMDLFLGYVGIMLRGKDNGFQADGLFIFIVFHGYLALSVGP